MFRTFARKFLPNPLDWKLRRAAKLGCNHVMIPWNRGLGDLALGLCAVIHRVREILPGAKITFLTREQLKDGFSLLPGVQCLVAPGWERGKKSDIRQTLNELGVNVKQLYILEDVSPTDWCRWQLGKLVPRLQWNEEYNGLWKKFGLPEGFTYIGVQVAAETNHGPWRDWPLERWKELFDRLAKLGYVRVLLFGYGTEPVFSHPMIIDLRGKTTLFELLSIVKNRCSAAIFPDSGLLSMTYYLDVAFPLRLISLWADPNHGILKQGVASPNPKLIHCPLIGEKRDLSAVSVEQVLQAIFPRRIRTPLRHSPRVEDLPDAEPVRGAACVILAGGQGSRLGVQGPKGLFSVLGKSLFQYHMEKVPNEMPVVVMVSPLNREETVAYFQQLDRDVSFICQDMMPLLDDSYREVGVGPDGNGGIYELLVSSGLLDQWKGIEDLLIIPVENPLADPADRKLLAFHRQAGADVTIKCVERQRGESMGMLVEEGGRIAIAEYFDGVEESEPSFSYPGQLAVSCAFVRKAAKVALPYRWVRKTANGMQVWKREKLIFDALCAAERIQTLCYPRKMCYAPIKGPESIATVERALQERL